MNLGHRVETVETNAPLRQAVWFVLLTFAVSLSVYLPLIASDRGWISVAVPGALAAVGVFSPAVAAVVLSVHENGRAGLRSLVGSATRWRFGRRWWAVTLALPPVVLGTMYAAFLLLGGEFRVASMLVTFREAGAQSLLLVPVLVLLTVVLAFGEEAGWRGYLLPLLQTRWNALTASLVLGVVWFLWHVPLLYLPNNANGGFPPSLWFVSIVASAITYTWLFNNTGGSILAVTLVHGGFNVWGRLVALHPSESGDVLGAFVITAGNGLLALLLLCLFGATTLARTTTPVVATPTDD